MDFRELVEASRSRRRFDQSCRIDEQTLVELIDLARFAPSGMNRQPLKYMPVASPELCDAVFPLLGWAGYLKDWAGPVEGERPTGYIIVLHDTDVASDCGCDHGIASQTVMLGAAERGYGGCMIGTVNKRKLKEIFQIEDHLEVLLVLALGVPAETVIVEPLPSDGKIEYWRTTDGVHHVPKRPLEEVVLLPAS